MSGKLIVIEGLDGSGKATQAQRLYEYLKNVCANVTKVSFPDYESNSSALVKMYLAGEFGTEADSVNPYAASSFYAVDRFASYTKNWKDFYCNGGIVISDRYTTSNAVHQCAKLPKEEWDGFIKWLFDYEYRLLGIPEPYRTIYLRVDPEMSQELMTKRYEGNESKKDIHEADVDYLRRSRQAADYCAAALGWNVVECVKDGKMREIGDISAEILRIVSEGEME
ncbi:MAG: deoxynucleoside kinase [Ruminococcus flavefaciens]|nr:deoxynucleoside kinase [Ruminococcus flavefaciens]MCM1132928.1 deoxynucleoside kinase [Ruminococcus flavefaciens]MCM1230499.1 deoxynucleoside kinase [Ruminococcus flavefaciens]MCM1230521.1 deoxynucleoside kinase [Ruminococcus flavefaciens]